LNSVYQQTLQAVGEKSPLLKGGKLNPDNLDADLSTENIAFLRKAAISGDVRTAATLRLAYVLAKRVDPNGRISDADVRLATDMIQGSADQSSAILQLKNLKNNTIRDFNTSTRNRADVLKLGDEDKSGVFSTIGVPDGKPKSVKEMSDDELLNGL